MAINTSAAASSPEADPHSRIPSLLRRQKMALVRATHHPKLNPGCHIFQSVRDAFEQAHFPDGKGLDAYVTRASDAYMEYRARAVIRMITRLRISNGQNLQDLADLLEVDRSVLSIAFNHGELGSRPLANLLSDPFVLANLFSESREFRSQMGRAGFIATANTTAGLVGPHLVRMNEVNYELLCAVFVRSDSEDLPKSASPQIVAAAIADLRSRVGAVPAWCIGSDYVQQEAALDLLKQFDDPTFGINYIHSLQRDWIKIFVYVWATVEGLGCEDLWQNE